VWNLSSKCRRLCVVPYDGLLDMITDLTKQLTDLKHTLEWIDPFRGSD
jgi:hypothetical protein